MGLCSQDQLCLDFPLIPKPYVRERFVSCASFYAPTHLALIADLSQTPPPFNLKTVPTRISAKGKARQYEDEDLQKERTWLEAKLLEMVTGPAPESQDPSIPGDEVLLEDGTGIECGCCFSEYPFVRSFRSR